MSITLSVIIVNYNGFKYLKDCFDSLYINLSGVAFEILVFDNNSQDQSCSYIKKNYPAVKLISSSVNHGFGKGNNEAIKQSEGEYLLLINNDTIVLDHLLPVFEHLKSNPSIGAIGINMLDANKKYLPVTGDFPSIFNMLRMKNIQYSNIELSIGNFTKQEYEVDWLSGSFLMMPRKVFEEVGGFDEDYFLYVEDVDLSRKIADKGYKRILLPNYKYVHYVGFNSAKNPLLIKGYEIYIDKHFKGIYKMSISIALKINKYIKISKRMLKLD